MEYLEDNLEEWLGTELEGYGDDDYLVFDCPGQVGYPCSNRRPPAPAAAKQGQRSDLAVAFPTVM